MSPLSKATMETQFEAMDRLRYLLNKARKHELAQAASACLATVGMDGHPAIHSIEIASILDLGPVFFAHRDSDAQQQISQHPQVALSISWPAMRQQITIDGTVRVLTNEEAEVIWYRQQNPQDQVLRPGDIRALLLEPRSLAFWSEQQAVAARREVYTQDADRQWQKREQQLAHVA